MIVISDTSPISYLFKINQLELLKLLFGSVIIPVAVYDELLQVEEQASWLNNKPDWMIVKSASNHALVETFRKVLDKGESEAIALATELHADALLIDEAKGRFVAKQEGIQVTGVMGILLEAKHQNLITSIKPLLEILIQNHFRISDTVYTAILKSANEL